MKKLLVFHHGWGLDSSYFVEFEKKFDKKYYDFFHFDSCYYKDLDNYKEQTELLIIISNKYNNITGIGHSIGFSKLLKLLNNIKFNKLISIAGFIRFINNEIDLRGLERTILEFEADSRSILNKFYNQDINYINKKKLLNEMIFLKECNLTNSILNFKNSIQFYHLYQENDPILSTIKSINNQIGTNIFQEHLINGRNHFFDISFQDKLEEILKNNEHI